LDTELREPPCRRKAKWTKNERGSGDLTETKTIKPKRSSGGRTSRWASPEKRATHTGGSQALLEGNRCGCYLELREINGNKQT
jgi:hypothetical protein